MNSQCISALGPRSRVGGLAALSTAVVFGSSLAQAGLISVDIQPSSTLGFPIMSGVESHAATADTVFSAADVWNEADLPSDFTGGGAHTDPSWSDLVDSTGTPTTVGFSITGTVDGTQVLGLTPPAESDLTIDSLFFADAGRGLSATLDWQITGLTPGVSFKLYLHQLDVFNTLNLGQNRAMEGLIDTNGDGTPNEAYTMNFPGVLVSGVVGADGIIRGTSSKLTGGLEPNWAGWQLHTESGTDQLNLRVASNGANLDFTWNSRVGQVYDLLSSTDPETDGDPDTWTAVANQEGIAATPGTNTLTIARPADAKRFYVIRERQGPPLFFDDFETVQSWTNGANGGDSGNTVWERGAPASLSSNGIPPSSGANGSANCFGTNISADYGPTTDIYLRSPVINLATGGLTEATLIMQHFLDTEIGSANDAGTIRVLRAGDLTQLGANVATDLNDFPSNNTDWKEFKADLPAEALGEMIILEFQFVSDDQEEYAGRYIDDVTVEVR